jgi:hypothetical protein
MYSLPADPTSCPSVRKKFLTKSAALGRVVGGWQVAAYCRYTDGAAQAVTAGNGISALGYPVSAPIMWEATSIARPIRASSTLPRAYI